MEIEPTSVKTEYYIHHARFLELLIPIDVDSSNEERERSFACNLAEAIEEIVNHYPATKANGAYGDGGNCVV
jgi:hypothetical protein